MRLAPVSPSESNWSSELAERDATVAVLRKAVERVRHPRPRSGNGHRRRGNAGGVLGPLSSPFFEAASCKYPLGVEGLTRIRAIYLAEAKLREKTTIDRKRARLQTVQPLLDDFFPWVNATSHTTTGRTLATRALGYGRNQEQPLRSVLLDWRLPLDNSRSERALRKVVLGRKNWLFDGSDVHAQAAFALLLLIASCRLHCVEPGQYLDELMKFLPSWPNERQAELAPKSWAATRARLDPEERGALIGAISVPPPLPASRA